MNYDKKKLEELGYTYIRSDTYFSRRYFKPIRFNVNEKLKKANLPLAAFPIKTLYQIYLEEIDNMEGNIYLISVHLTSDTDKPIDLKFWGLNIEDIPVIEERINLFYKMFDCLPTQNIECSSLQKINETSYQ